MILYITIGYKYFMNRIKKVNDIFQSKKIIFINCKLKYLTNLLYYFYYPLYMSGFVPGFFQFFRYYIMYYNVEY